MILPVQIINLPAFWRVEATDLLAQDAGGWASYEGALAQNLKSTLQSYSSCQTGFMSDVVISSSSPGVEMYERYPFLVLIQTMTVCVH